MASTVKLNLRLAYIDKYGTLKFVWVDGPNKQLIDAAAGAGKSPIFNYGCTAKLDTKIKYPELQQLVGRVCAVELKPRRYSFTSRLEETRGQKVEGTRLILIDITPA